MIELSFWIAASPAFPGGETGLETRTRGLAALRRFVIGGSASHPRHNGATADEACPAPGIPPAKTSNTVLYILRYAPVADRLAVLEAGAR